MSSKFRTASLILSLALFATAASGCGQNPHPEDTPDEPSVSAPVELPEMTGNPVIEETVLLDQDSLKITAKELVFDTETNRNGIKVEISNNSEHNMHLYLDSLTCNGFSTLPMWAEDVAAGEVIEDVLEYNAAMLESYGLGKAQEFELRFDIKTDAMVDLFTTDKLHLETNYAAAEDPTYEPGQELYSGNGFTVSAKYENDNEFFGRCLLVYMENQSGKRIHIGNQNTVRINEVELPDYMITTDLDDKDKCIYPIHLSDPWLTEHGIKPDELKDITFDLLASGYYDFTNVAHTGTQTFHIS